MGSRLITSIRLKGQAGVLVDSGRCTRAEMIAYYKGQAKRALADAQAILDAADGEFEVKQYTGERAQRDVKWLNPGVNE